MLRNEVPGVAPGLVQLWLWRVSPLPPPPLRSSLAFIRAGTRLVLPGEARRGPELSRTRPRCQRHTPAFCVNVSGSTSRVAGPACPLARCWVDTALRRERAGTVPVGIGRFCSPVRPMGCALQMLGDAAGFSSPLRGDLGWIWVSTRSFLLTPRSRPAVAASASAGLSLPQRPPALWGSSCWSPGALRRCRWCRGVGLAAGLSGRVCCLGPRGSGSGLRGFSSPGFEGWRRRTRWLLPPSRGSESLLV